MNRETKRRLQRQGQLGPDGAPGTTTKRPTPPRPAPKPAGQRTSPATFLKEVRGELRKVAWPTRAETTNYSIVVLCSLVFIIALIFVLDLAFSKSVLFLFKT
ncbi:MAG TPA: preprotein translocase subunit SecE [Acidimicrobiales bacterium]|nr:preprotein translocase subunit SecE [Acidimicrobiales bacterium]